MTEESQETMTGERVGSSSRLSKTVMIILAAFLTFAGPTYIPYVLLNIVDLNYFISMGTGFVLFIVGVVLFWLSIKKGTIS